MDVIDSISKVLMNFNLSIDVVDDESETVEFEVKPIENEN